MKNALPALNAFLKLATLCLIFFSFTPSFAQKPTDEYNRKPKNWLRLIYLQSNSELFLNKSIFTTDEIASFRQKPKNKKGQTIITTTADEWENLYKRLVLSDVNEKNRLVEASAFIPTNRATLTASNTISLGILNFDGVLLTEAQLTENAKQKAAGKKADADRYEHIFFFAASVL